MPPLAGGLAWSASVNLAIASANRLGSGRAFRFWAETTRTENTWLSACAMVQWGRAKAKRIQGKILLFSRWRTVDGGTVANAHHRQHFARG